MSQTTTLLSHLYAVVFDNGICKTVATKSVTASTRIKRAAAARKAMIASGRTVIT